MKKPYFTMAVIAWAIFVVIVLATHVKANSDLSAAEPPQVNASEIGEDPEEEVKIAEALLEQGYFRDDIPLSYEEQDYLHTACEEFGVDHALMLALIEHISSNIQKGDGFIFNIANNSEMAVSAFSPPDKSIIFCKVFPGG